MQFCDKLKISARDYYFSLDKKDNYIHLKIKKIYECLVSKQYEKTNYLIKHFSLKIPLTNQNNRFFQYCKLRYNYETNKTINISLLTQKINKYLSYPECSNSKVFDFVDILFLMLISQIEIRQNKVHGLNALINILNSPEFLYLSSENRDILPPIYSNVSIMLGKLNRFSECIKIAEDGISYCNKYSYSKSLTRLYYSLSIANKKLNHLSDAEYNASLCLASAISTNNSAELNIFYELLRNDYNKDPFLQLMQNKGKLLKNN